MPISDVVNVSVSVSGAGPARAGFGEPLLAVYNPPFSTGVREYSTLAGMASDGFAVTHPAYLMATNLKAQNPSVTAWKVGRRALAYTQVLHLTLLSASALDTYVIQVRTPGGAWHVITMASTGVVATDATSLAAAVTALSLAHLTMSHSSGVVTFTMAAGYLIDLQPGPASLATLADATTDPGIATDLAAILAADSNWYGLLLDSQSPAEITAAAAWAEGNGPRLFGYNSSDSECADPSSTTDIFYTEKSLNHARSFGIFAATQLLSYSAAAWMGNLFPTDAGSENWAFKTLNNVPTDVLTDTQIHAVENKNASVYTSLMGVSITQFGKQPGGEWIDVTRGTDAFTNDLQVGILNLQVNNRKVPFTDAGIDMFRSVINASLQKFIVRGFLSSTPPPTISLPTAASISPTDKANRNLPNASCQAELAGAINSLTLNVTLTQ